MIADLELQKETTVSVLDAILMLHKSWQEVSSSTIANCFRHSSLSELPTSPAPDVSEIYDQLETILPLATSDPVTGNDFLDIDDEITTAEAMSEEEIVATVQKHNADCDKEEEINDEDLHLGSAPSLAEAQAALITLQTYGLVNNESSCIEELKKLELKMNLELLKKKKQTTL